MDLDCSTHACKWTCMNTRARSGIAVFDIVKCLRVPILPKGKSEMVYILLITKIKSSVWAVISTAAAGEIYFWTSRYDKKIYTQIAFSRYSCLRQHCLAFQPCDLIVAEVVWTQNASALASVHHHTTATAITSAGSIWGPSDTLPSEVTTA